VSPLFGSRGTDGSMAQVIRHPRFNLAAAYWIVLTRRFDPRVVSRKKLKPKPQLIRHQRSYFSNNGKLKRPEVLHREAEREARYLAEHPEPGNLLRPHETDDWDDLPF